MLYLVLDILKMLLYYGCCSIEWQITFFFGTIYDRTGLLMKQNHSVTHNCVLMDNNNQLSSKASYTAKIASLLFCCYVY